MIVVPLTRGLHALVDDEDADLVLAHSWQAVECDGIWYARRAASYAELDAGAPTVRYMHAEITGYARTDHVNGLTLDNRRANLREVTSSQNSMNRGAGNGWSSRYKGVHYFRRTGRWRAYITFGRKQKHLGYFSTEREAAEAYNAAAIELFGDFARLNVLERRTS